MGIQKIWMRDRVMLHPRLPMCRRRKEKYLEWRTIPKRCPWPLRPLEVERNRPRKNVRKRTRIRTRRNHLKVAVEKRRKRHMKNLNLKMKTMKITERKKCNFEFEILTLMTCTGLDTTTTAKL